MHMRFPLIFVGTCVSGIRKRSPGWRALGFIEDSHAYDCA